MVLTENSVDLIEENNLSISDNSDDIITQKQQEERIQLFGNCIVPALSHNNNHKDINVLASLRCSDQFEDNDKRAKLIVVAVVDISGSMAGLKLVSLINTLCFLITKLSKNDQFAIVTYSTVSSVVFPLSFMDDNTKLKATKVAENLRTLGSTNLCEGLIEGIRLLPKDMDSNTVASVFLMTDGHVNAGITTKNGILSNMELNLRNKNNVSVNTFGYGCGHDVDLLQSISSKSEGTYFYIDSNDSISSAFAECIGGLISVLGQNLELIIEKPSNDINISKIHTCYKTTEIENGYRIHLGNIQAAEERDILITIDVNSIPMSSFESKILNLYLSYYDVTDEEMKEIQSNISIARPSELKLKEEHTLKNKLVDKHNNRVITVNAIKNATKAAENTNFSEAQRILNEAKTIVENSISNEDEFCLTLIKEIHTALNSTSNNKRYRTSSCGLTQSRLSLSTQRSSNSSSNLFISPFKKKMVFDSADFELQRNERSKTNINILNSYQSQPNRIPRRRTLTTPVKRNYFDSYDFQFQEKEECSKINKSQRSAIKQPNLSSMSDIEKEKKTVSFTGI